MLRIAPVATITLLLLAATGCAGPQQERGAVQDAAAPRPGGVLNMRLREDPLHWDATEGAGRTSSPGIALAYETLLKFDSGPGVGHNEARLIPSLAERWEVSPDARSFTFHLRKGVKFAPAPRVDGVNGRELTSADVKWSFEYAARSGEFKDLPPSGLAFLFEGIDGVDAPDPYTAAVRFKGPFAPFASYAGATGTNVILPRETHRQDGHFRDRMVGTGPFQLAPEASRSGGQWMFVKNPAYWREGRPYLDGIRFLVLEEPGAVQAAFVARQLDFLDIDVPLSEADQLRRMAPDAVYHETTQGYPWAFYMNQTKPPLEDPRVRRALSLSIDRDEMVRVFTRGKGTHLLPGVFPDYFSQDEVRLLQPYDIQRARGLLASAGYKDGVELEIIYPGQYYGNDYVSILELMQAQVRQAGFHIRLKNVDQTAFGRSVRSKAFTVAIQPGGNRRWDVDFGLSEWYPGAALNSHGVVDPKVVEYVDAQRRAVDPERRREIVRDLIRYVMEHQYGIGLFSRVSYSVWHPYARDLYPNRNLVVPPLEVAWLDK